MAKPGYSTVTTSDGPGGAVAARPRANPESEPALPVRRARLPAGGTRFSGETGEIGAGGAADRLFLRDGSADFVTRPRNELVDAAQATYASNMDPEYQIGPTDDREPVPDATEAPFRHVAALRIHLQGGRMIVGTGWLIGPRTLMTAGHCVHPHIDGASFTYHDWAESIEIYPAAQGVGPGDKPKTPVPPAVVKRVSGRQSPFLAPEGWWRGVDEEFDFGAILVADPPKEWKRLGYFSFTSWGDTELRKRTVNVTGYPTDVGDRTASRQYWCAQDIVRLTPRRMYYEVDTYGGQSGGPVFVQWREGEAVKRVAVGLHNYGDRMGVANSGARITPEMFEMMRAWKKQGA